MGRAGRLGVERTPCRAGFWAPARRETERETEPLSVLASLPTTARATPGNKPAAAASSLGRIRVPWHASPLREGWQALTCCLRGITGATAASVQSRDRDPGTHWKVSVRLN